MGETSRSADGTKSARDSCVCLAIAWILKPSVGADARLVTDAVNSQFLDFAVTLANVVAEETPKCIIPASAPY
jgi:hypothetical protein